MITVDYEDVRGSLKAARVHILEVALVCRSLLNQNEKIWLSCALGDMDNVVDSLEARRRNEERKNQEPLLQNPSY